MTRRQVEIFKGMIEGLSRKEIASRLNVSGRTVAFYMSRIYASYGVHSRAELLSKLGRFEVSVKWIPNKKFKEAM